MAAERESHPQFEPLQTASRTWRVLIIIFGPVLWLSALILVTIVIRGVDAIELALAVTFGALLFSLVFCWVGRQLRLREEKKAAGS